jgi:ribosomal protein S18 acetylase RimI-like enzyme
LKNKKLQLFFLFLKRFASICLRKIQGVPFYKRIVAPLGRGIIVEEADKKTSDLNNPCVVAHIVAKRNDKVVGFVQLLHYPEGDAPFIGYWLMSLTVRPLFRCLGIGEELTKKVTDKASLLGAKDLSLLVFEDNAAAIKLYEKLGFKHSVISRIEAELEKEKSIFGRRRIAMVKTL